MPDQIRHPLNVQKLIFKPNRKAIAIALSSANSRVGEWKKRIRIFKKLCNYDIRMNFLIEYELSTLLLGGNFAYHECKFVCWCYL